MNDLILTKMLQRKDSILHVDPEAKSTQGDGVIGDSEGNLCCCAVDLLGNAYKASLFEQRPTIIC